MSKMNCPSKNTPYYYISIKEQNWPKIGDYSLGRTWAELNLFGARRRVQNVPKVTQKCQKRIVHPKIPHNSRITEQNWS